MKKMSQFKRSEIIEFLDHSNRIENERSPEALAAAIEAWDYAFRYRKNVNLNYILKIHEKLLIGLNKRIAGKFRDDDVRIGGQIRFFVSMQLLEETMRGWCKSYKRTLKHSDKSKKRKNDITKDTHVIFERIHPFFDGNGRTGRILYNIHRHELGLPIHIIHEGMEQDFYYTWFN